MIKKAIKYLMILILIGMINVGVLLTCAFTQTGINNLKIETQTQIIKNITTEEAFNLIQENKDNPDFVIIDVRTPKEFSDEHLENAINLDYTSNTFREQLDKLAKYKIYLIYCRTGVRSGNALQIIKKPNLNFREVYNMLGGITKWKSEFNN